jgi:hypothetical protein
MAERGNKFAIAVCEVLGIKPHNVKRIVIEADAQDVLNVHVDFIPSLEATQAMPAICDALSADPKVVELRWVRGVQDATSITDDLKRWTD